MRTSFLTLTCLLLCIISFAQKTTIVKCDYFYKNKGFTIQIKRFEHESDGYEGEKNSILIISQKRNGKNYILIKDSIFSRVQKIEFKDFNNDKIKDILVQNISDVRSNWTYNLYLYNPKANNLKRVNGFEEIKNPKYNAKYNIIESYIVSGEDWIFFYGIKNNRIFNYDVRAKDDHRDNFEKEYEKAIKKIIAIQQKQTKY